MLSSTTFICCGIVNGNTEIFILKRAGMRSIMHIYEQLAMTERALSNCTLAVSSR
jgi:hypothetical protein